MNKSKIDSIAEEFALSNVFAELGTLNYNSLISFLNGQDLSLPNGYVVWEPFENFTNQRLIETIANLKIQFHDAIVVGMSLKNN